MRIWELDLENLVMNQADTILVFLCQILFMESWHCPISSYWLCWQSSGYSKEKEKKKKRNINNNLAILPSHDTCSANNPQAKCMVNGKCSKHFPKEYRERIDWAEDSYPLYARPNNGLVFEHNGLDSLINMWSLTVLNFSFSLIVISMLRSLLDWELSSIWASTSTRVLIEQLWRLVVECRMKSRLIWMVALLVQQKLTRRSLNLTCIESHQQSNVFLSIFPMNTIVRRIESSNYSRDKWWPTHWVI